MNSRTTCGAFSWIAFLSSGFLLLTGLLQSLTAGPVARFPVDFFSVGLAYDGADIWVTNNGGGEVSKLRASDGELLGAFAAGGNALYAAYDGTNVWFTNPDNNTVTELRASDARCRALSRLAPARQGSYATERTFG